MLKWKKHSERKSESEGILLNGILEEVVAGGVSETGKAWVRLKLKFNESTLPFFADSEEEMNKSMKELKEGESVKLWLTGKGEKVIIARIEKLEREEEG